MTWTSILMHSTELLWS